MEYQEEKEMSEEAVGAVIVDGEPSSLHERQHPLNPLKVPQSFHWRPREEGDGVRSLHKSLMTT